MSAETEARVCLPYFSRATDAFDKAVRRHIIQRSRKGFLSEIGAHSIFEGRKTTIKQSDQSERSSEIKEMSAEVEAKKYDLEKLDREFVERQINEIADQFRTSMSKNMLELMSQVTKETGQVFDAGGKPLTNEILLDLRRSMPALSDPFSDESPLMMVVPPGMANRIQELEKEFDSSPELQKKYQEMLQQKHEEYRSDKLGRELVG